MLSLDSDIQDAEMTEGCPLYWWPPEFQHPHLTERKVLPAGPRTCESWRARVTWNGYYFWNSKTVKTVKPQNLRHKASHTKFAKPQAAFLPEALKAGDAPVPQPQRSSMEIVLRILSRSAQLPNLWLTKCENLTVECSGSSASTVFAPFWNDFLKTAWSS